MYNHNFILGQLITAANQPTDIENYVCKDNEVKLFSCICDLATGEFKGIHEQVAYIVQHEVINTRLSFRTDSKSLNLKFYIHTRKIKFQMLSFQQLFEDIILKLLMKKRERKIHHLCFSFCHR